MTVPRVQLTEGGPELSRIALGLWRLADWPLREKSLLGFIESCLEMGITTFDHADIYGDYQCEALFGHALSQAPELRARMEIVTKCGIKLLSDARPGHTTKHYDTTREHIVASVDRSLVNLTTDRIDLLLIHRPDPFMDPDDTAAGLLAVHRAGKVAHVGVSNFTPSQYDMLASRLPMPLVTNQVEFSPLALDVLHDGTVDHCLLHRIIPMAWSPLAGGRLFSATTTQAVRLRAVLEDIGAAHDGASLDQAALAWVFAHPARFVTVLGTGKLERVTAAVEAEDLRLSREEWFQVWTAATGHEVP